MERVVEVLFKDNIKETLKTFIICLLIALGLIQAAVVWDLRSQGSAFYVVGAFLKHSDNANYKFAQLAPDIIIPQRVVISDGEQTYQQYFDLETIKMLWKPVVKFIQIGFESSVRFEVSDLSKWAELCQKRSVRFDFPNPVHKDIFAFCIPSYNESRQQIFPDAYYKILVVLPAEGIRSTFASIYFNTGKQLFKMDVNSNISEFIKILSRIKPDYVRYSMIKDFDPQGKSFVNFEPDVLSVMIPPKHKNFKGLEMHLPKAFENPGKLKQALLGYDKGSFEHSEDSKGVITFKNIDNVYKIYPDGFIYYKDISGVKSDRESMNESLDNAAAFIKKINDIFERSEVLYISDITKDKNGEFVISLDYTTDTIPVVFDINKDIHDGKPLKHAITLRVNSRKVTEVRGYLINFAYTRHERNFNMLFEDILNFNGINFSSLDVSSMHAAYVIQEDAIIKNSSAIWPSWLINGKNDGIKLLKLP